MRRIILVATALFFSLAAYPQTNKAYGLKDIPNVQLLDQTRFVSNPDNILSSDAVYRIDTMLFSLKQNGRAQVAVIAVNSIGDVDPFTFLHELMDKNTGWGVGMAGEDNGLGVLLVIDQGTIEIQTGYGLEGDLPDAIVKRVINNYMLPAFRERDWDKGMVDGIEAISGILNGRPPAGVQPERVNIGGIIALIVLFLGLPAGIVALVLLANRCPRCRKRKWKRLDSKIVSRGSMGKVEETSFVCLNCGYIKKVTRNLHDNSGFGGPGGRGPIVGGGMGRGTGGFGGGSTGGSWGGGGFGGGGARGKFYLSYCPQHIHE